MGSRRATFTSDFGLLMTMIGVAVGLGNVWRFPYMVWEFGGSTFVACYLLCVLTIGIPALAAEWALGRHTRRGPLGAFQRGGLPAGRAMGRLIYFVVWVAVGYYAVAVGWVGFYAAGAAGRIVGLPFDAGVILPPDTGFDGRSFGLQLLMTALVVGGGGVIIALGLKRGIERASKLIMPTLFVVLIALVGRSLTLDGAGTGLAFCLGLGGGDRLDASCLAAAMGQAIFSLSLGGSFMLIYGSYMAPRTGIGKKAVITGLSDALAGVLAALAIIPAAVALLPEVGSDGAQAVKGAKLLFATLPAVFAHMPGGGAFGLLFFGGLFGAAFLSAIAALEVLVGGLVDNTSLSRKRAVALTCGSVWLISIPPSINMTIFIPWDLTFGSGMQVCGALLAVVTAVWCVNRSAMLAELSRGAQRPFPRLLYWWMRVAIPAMIATTGLLWFLEDVEPYLRQTVWPWLTGLLLG